MKKKIIAVIAGAVILIIAAGSIYGKPESSHKEGEPDVVGTFSVNRDENLTVVANREHIEDREAFARELLQMYNTTPEEVRREMQIAIDAGFDNPDPAV